MGVREFLREGYVGIEDGGIPKLEKIWSLGGAERTSCSKCTKNLPKMHPPLCKKYKMKKIKNFLKKSIDNGVKGAIIILVKGVIDPCQH